MGKMIIPISWGYCNVKVVNTCKHLEQCLEYAECSISISHCYRKNNNIKIQNIQCTSKHPGSGRQ